MNKISVVISGILLLVSSSCFAFKVDTHVWISQQVIKDLMDGYLSFRLSDGLVHKVAVNPKTKDAILHNQSAYRMGNIGPDAAPSIFAGQLIIHPGEEGWAVHEWLDWGMSQALSKYGGKEQAYMYGFLSHAAADVFAHTYVNLYSGGSYILTDEDFAVEARHVMLESLISERTPNVKDLSISSPSQFLRDEFILNDTMSSQYSFTGVSHLSIIHELRKSLESILNSKELEKLEEQMLNYASEAIFGVTIPDPLLNELNSLVKQIDKLGSESIDEAQRLAKRLHDVTTKLRLVEQRLELDVINGGEKILLETVRFQSNVLSALVSLEQEKARIIKSIGKQVEKKVCDKWTILLFGLGPCISHKIVKEWSSAQKRLWAQVDKLNTSISNESKRAIRKQVGELKTAARSIHGIINEADGAAFQLANAAVDIMQRFGGLYPHRNILEGWIADIDRVMLNYVDANAEVITGTIYGNLSLSPLTDWLSCESMALVGIPLEVPQTVCSLKDSYSVISGYAEDLVGAGLALSNPLLAEGARYLNDKIDAELGRVRSRLEQALIDEVVSEELQELIELYKKRPTETIVDALFKDSGSPFSLLAIPDMTDRVEAEMNKGSCRTFDPNSYSVIANAVNLAKLSILSGQELNTLTNQIVVASSGSAINLFSGMDTIFTSALRTIDGNHQWMEYAPPFPRSSGYPDYEEHQFGYGSHDGGFKLWQNRQARSLVFRRLFDGPLAPGIESPEEIGFSKVLANDYPYVTCTESSFPTLDEGKPGATICK